MKRSDIKGLPSQEILLQLLNYNPETGILTWRRKNDGSKSSFGFNNKCAGKVAGTTTSRGYLAVGIRKNDKPTYYLAHRLIWKMMTGDDPVDQIDHNDGDRQNNRWFNLRPADNGKNIANSKLRIDNTSGFKGVHLRKNGGTYRKWRAVITANGIHHRLGHFDTPEEASAARELAAQKLHGEFARSA